MRHFINSRKALKYFESGRFSSSVDTEEAEALAFAQSER